MKSGINTLLASIALALSSSVMAQTIALQNVNLIDVEALSVNKAQTIIIEDDKIKQIVPANSRRFADDVIKIDLAGKYVIPGLIDTHVHHATSPDDSDNDEITRTRLRQLLQGGVTSVRDMGGDTRAVSAVLAIAAIQDSALPACNQGNSCHHDCPASGNPERSLRAELQCAQTLTSQITQWCCDGAAYCGKPWACAAPAQ